MAKEPKKLDELFHDTLKDIYFAEKKILTTLPKMAKAAQSEALRAAFEKHEAETEEQVGRLEQVFAAIDKKPQGKTCAAIVGITEEGAEIMMEYKGSPALDAGLLAAAQAVEHYEISRHVHFELQLLGFGPRLAGHFRGTFNEPCAPKFLSISSPLSRHGLRQHCP